MKEFINGFEEDYQTFLSKYLKENDPSFPTFAKIWREMHFSLVYAGRNLRDFGIFASESFSFVKKHLLNTPTLLEQIFDIYMLHGLFYKQPEFKLMKIMITLEDWCIIKDIIENLKKFNCTHALYIIYKMIFNDVFEFSADGQLRNCCVASSDNYLENSADYISGKNNKMLRNDYKKLAEGASEYSNALDRLAEKGIQVTRYFPKNFTEQLRIFTQNNDVQETTNLNKTICNLSVSESKVSKGRLHNTMDIISSISIGSSHYLRNRKESE